MFNKLYAKTKKYIKKNHNFILVLILTVLILNIKLPYIVERPGGISPINKQMKIDGKYIKGNYYTSYVKVNKGSVATVLVGYLMPRWDVVNLSEFTSDDDQEYNDAFKLDRVAMDYSHNVAVKVVFDKLDIPYTISKEELYVYSKVDGFNNDLKTNDKITKCDGYEINYFYDLSSCINNSEDNNVDLEVVRNGKNHKLSADVNINEGKKVIGIVVLRYFVVDSNTKISFDNNKNESGSSGGLMTALALYDNLSGNTLIKNLKVAGTGTVDENGCVGEIDGIKYKLLGTKNKVDVFFVPADNFEEAKKVKKKYKLKTNIVRVETIDDAISYLNDFKK